MISVRLATEEDAPQLLAIYRPHITEGTATFEEEVPQITDFSARISFIQKQHLWLVAEENGQIVSYAYGSPHRSRAAYAPTCETSVYTLPSAQGRGLGKRLYLILLECLADMGYRTALGVITLPNQASEKFHSTLGFERVIVHPRIGFKHGQWQDTVWYRKELRASETEVFSRRPFSEIQEQEEVRTRFSPFSGRN